MPEPDARHDDDRRDGDGRTTDAGRTTRLRGTLPLPLTLAPRLRELGRLIGSAELSQAVEDLLAGCVVAVPSTLAVRVTTPALGPRWAIEAGDVAGADRNCRASLRLDLIGHGSGADLPVRISVLVLAERAGAFADFVGGADPRGRPGVRIVRRGVDEDLPPGHPEVPPPDTAELDTAEPDEPEGSEPDEPEGSEPDGPEPSGARDDTGALDPSVRHHPAVNRAVGVLIDRGYPPDEALHLLRHRAAGAGRSLLDEAREVLRSTRDGTGSV